MLETHAPIHLEGKDFDAKCLICNIVFLTSYHDYCLLIERQFCAYLNDYSFGVPSSGIHYVFSMLANHHLMVRLIA